jgi:hypothetical protein
MNVLRKMLILPTIGIAASASVAIAQDVTLKVAHIYADNHYLSQNGHKVWMGEVAR